MIFVGYGSGEGVGGRCRNCNCRTGVGFRFKDYKEVSNGMWFREELEELVFQLLRKQNMLSFAQIMEPILTAASWLKKPEHEEHKQEDEPNL